jgi:ABC-type transport system involved in multi-copper enzyme maturation permease subunit
VSWLTWRQFRGQAAVAAGCLAILAVVAALTGWHLAHLYDTTVATCHRYRDCSTVTSAFLRNDSTLRTWLGVLVVVGPGIIGIFWGAPLVARELETGTYRLAWTQSATRSRWLAVKLGLVGLASMVAAGLLSLVVTWWSSPLDRAGANVFGSFDQRDIVPIGYAAFAFVLGTTVGVLIRRTLPAMAATLVLFVAARLAMIHSVRPYLITPVLRVLALNPASTGYGSSGSLLSGFGQSTLQPAPPNIPNAWILSIRIVDKAGAALTNHVLTSYCPGIGGPAGSGGGPAGGHTRVPVSVQKSLQDCVARVGTKYHELVSFQPANRYWTFQWYELAIYLGAALVLAGACFWWVRRRLA